MRRARRRGSLLGVARGAAHHLRGVVHGQPEEEPDRLRVVEEARREVRVCEHAEHAKRDHVRHGDGHLRLPGGQQPDAGGDSLQFLVV